MDKTGITSRFESLETTVKAFINTYVRFLDNDTKIKETLLTVLRTQNNEILELKKELKELKKRLPPGDE